VAEPHARARVHFRVRRRSPRRAPAFTLLELLLVLLILAVLLALAFPIYRGMMGQRRDVAAVNRLREHARAVLAYTADARGQLPQVAAPGTDRSEEFPAEPIRARSYFSASIFWPTLVYGSPTDPTGSRTSPWYTPPTPTDPASPVRDYDARNERSSYVLTCSYLATPAFWNVMTREGPHQWRPLGIESFQFPASKGLVIDLPWWWSAKLGDTPTMALANADGSVHRAPLDAFTPGYFKGDGPWFKAGALHQAAFAPGQHTIDGTNGRDF
jgi:prepilin-type N-terminal cleavage/methylation domain-containing protein